MLTFLPLVVSVALAEEPAPAPAAATAPAPHPVIAQIEARYAKVDAMKMAFTQTVSSPLYGDQTQTGTVAFARPGKMNWAFTGEGKHYISDGSVMWVYLEQDRQAFKYSGWDPSQSAESLLASLDNLGKLFAVTVKPDTGETHELILRPRSEAAYDNVGLVLNSELVVTAVTLSDAMGTTTKLEFSGVELGPELPADTFTFSPPEGVEVIEAAFPQQ